MSEQCLGSVTNKNRSQVDYFFERHTVELLLTRYGPEVQKGDYFQFLSWQFHFPKPIAKNLLHRMKYAGFVRIERYKIVILEGAHG